MAKRVITSMSESISDNQTLSVIQSFNKTFESSNLVDTLSQVGEVGLDYLLELNDTAPIIKDIPVIGLLVSGTKTIANIRAHVLANKVYKFFYCIKDIPVEARQKFSDEYCRENREDVAVALLSILDRLNNQNYVPVICNLMRAKIYGFISIPEFNRAILALERIAYTDLIVLPKFNENYYEEEVAEALESAGLVYQSVIDGGGAESNSGGVKMKLSPTGRLLLAYGLGHSVNARVPRSTELKGGLGWVYVDDEEANDSNGYRR